MPFHYHRLELRATAFKKGNNFNVYVGTTGNSGDFQHSYVVAFLIAAFAAQAMAFVDANCVVMLGRECGVWLSDNGGVTGEFAISNRLIL